MVGRQKTTVMSNTKPNFLSLRLARNIAHRRRTLALTQAQLAERLGVDTETLSRFERGKHMPSLLMLERLAKILMTTIAALLEEETQQVDGDALMMAAWLAELSPADRDFARNVLKQCCDYLTARGNHSD